MNERRMGRPVKGEKYVALQRVTYRLQPELVKALNRAAAKEHVTKSAFVERAIRNEIERLAAK
jgi:predicted transcriptional regulator